MSHQWHHLWLSLFPSTTTIPKLNLAVQFFESDIRNSHLLNNHWLVSWSLTENQSRFIQILIDVNPATQPTRSDDPRSVWRISKQQLPSHLLWESLLPWGRPDIWHNMRIIFTTSVLWSDMMRPIVASHWHRVINYFTYNNWSLSLSVKPTSLAILAKPSFVSAHRQVEAVCQAVGGFPPPKLTWWVGSKKKRPHDEVS